MVVVHLKTANFGEVGYAAQKNDMGRNEKKIPERMASYN